MNNEASIKSPQPGPHFYTGATVLVIGFLLPLLIPFVSYIDVSTEVRTLISGILLVGGPEAFSVIAIAIMGKSGFLYIKSKVFALLRRATAVDEVSRLRYNIGLLLLIPHVVFAYLTFYAPHWLPGYDEYRVAFNLTADFLFVITLVILGQEFWEKVRALFIYDAKASIPQKT